MAKITQIAGRNALGTFAPDFAHFNDDILFGENWNNEDIDLKTRSIITVVALMQKTGLSRGFFYKNPIVRGEIDAAMEQQAGMVDPRRNIISQAMEAEMNLLRQQIQKLKSENENLIKENQKLKKALSKKELNLIKQI